PVDILHANFDLFIFKTPLLQTFVNAFYCVG
ncbi:MAG: hypothetical protein ACI9BD_001469, partial [Candidatus Marinamargulisbacteria bacterium]